MDLIPLRSLRLCSADHQIRPKLRKISGVFFAFAQFSDSRKFAQFASFAAYLFFSALSASAALLYTRIFYSCEDFFLFLFGLQLFGRLRPDAWYFPSIKSICVNQCHQR